MRIGIQTWGSHGDIRPFVALADGLQAAGHEVTLVITCVDSDRYAALQAQSRFGLRVVATPVIADAQVLASAGRAIVRERNAIRQTQMAIESFLLPAEAEMYRASEQLVAESDLVIGHYFLYTLGAAAEKRGRPCVSVALAHGAVPSAHQPPSGLPDLGRMGNRMAWWLARRVLNRAFKKYPDRLRAANGVAPARDMVDNVWASDYLTLLAISPAICEQRPDWPAHFHVCGPLDTPGSVAEGELSGPLESFLSAGDAPVFMTVGSMLPGSGESEAIALLADAAQAAKVRAIIQAPGWERLGFQCSDQFHFVDAVPHAAVFPRCSAVVHHGGAGTSQAALRAGVPSVVIPHTAEQEHWGSELCRIGVACKPIPRRKATPARIASALREATGSTTLAANARAKGASLANENGVAEAVRLIVGRYEQAIQG